MMDISIAAVTSELHRVGNEWISSPSQETADLFAATLLRDWLGVLADSKTTPSDAASSSSAIATLLKLDNGALGSQIAMEVFPTLAGALSQGPKACDASVSEGIVHGAVLDLAVALLSALPAREVPLVVNPCLVGWAQKVVGQAPVNGVLVVDDEDSNGWDVALLQELDVLLGGMASAPLKMVGAVREKKEVKVDELKRVSNLALDCAGAVAGLVYRLSDPRQLARSAARGGKDDGGEGEGEWADDAHDERWDDTPDAFVTMDTSKTPGQGSGERGDAHAKDLTPWQRWMVVEVVPRIIASFVGPLASNPPPSTPVLTVNIGAREGSSAGTITSWKYAMLVVVVALLAFPITRDPTHETEWFFPTPTPALSPPSQDEDNKEKKDNAKEAKAARRSSLSGDIVARTLSVLADVLALPSAVFGGSSQQFMFPGPGMSLWGVATAVLGASRVGKEGGVPLADSGLSKEWVELVQGTPLPPLGLGRLIWSLVMSEAQGGYPSVLSASTVLTSSIPALSALMDPRSIRHDAVAAKGVSTVSRLAFAIPLESWRVDESTVMALQPLLWGLLHWARQGSHGALRAGAWNAFRRLLAGLTPLGRGMTLAALLEEVHGQEADLAAAVISESGALIQELVSRQDPPLSPEEGAISLALSSAVLPPLAEDGTLAKGDIADRQASVLAGLNVWRGLLLRATSGNETGKRVVGTLGTTHVLTLVKGIEGRVREVTDEVSAVNAEAVAVEDGRDPNVPMWRTGGLSASERLDVSKRILFQLELLADVGSRVKELVSGLSK